MKPSVYRTCLNSKCEGYDNEVELSDKEKDAFYVSPYCPKCHHKGKLRLFHKGIEAETTATFYAIVGGMAKEFHLLKKLVAKGVADPEDQVRYDEVLELIKDLECIECSQKLIDHEHKKKKLTDEIFPFHAMGKNS
jgi:predicted RNA-binding protein YlxR (DUF448 family)